MQLVLRIGLYVQLLLGLTRMFGVLTNARIWELHLGIGILVAVLALIVLRGRPGLPASGLRMAARLLPTTTLLVGLGMTMGFWSGISVIYLHALLGIVSVGLVDMTLARKRRASRSSY